MFEKEAEEYSNGKGHEHYNCLFEEHAGSPSTFANRCFKDGAEFGYNKAKEEMQAQIEKLIDFVLSKTECCDVCPITDTCINSEGTCPYASILAKGEEEVTREWLIQFISRR